jgi:2-hydroxychromene-2-carboxylate isomerase
MKHIDFYLDFVSPYAYLAFERLPEALEGLSCSVSYRPVLLGALFKHHGHTAPVEVPSKRAWTYRHALWLGHVHGIPIEMPAAHPFDPLPHLRLALSAAGSIDGAVSRRVAEAVFRDIWRGGGDALDATRLAALATRLGSASASAPASASEVIANAKTMLRANTAQAIAHGAFGVPTCVVEGRLFWGFDGLAMLRAALHDDTWFAGPDWERAERVPSALPLVGGRVPAS